MNKRILFIAEAVTLAHLTRALIFAEILAKSNYEVFLACDPRYNYLLKDLPFSTRFIQSMSSERFLKNIAKGLPLFDTKTLKSYVEVDQNLLSEIRPDIVIGDLRFSLSISARLQKVPYMAITNAYWSPYVNMNFQLADHPLINMLGEPLAQLVFKLIAKPIGFAMHTMPLNQTRKYYGLPSLGYDLRKIYAENSDYTAYVDIPEMMPAFQLPVTHRYLGPVVWSPSINLPDWWSQIPTNKPIVYVNLGTSGDPKILNQLLEVLSKFDVTTIAATAGRIKFQQVPANVYLADFLSGIQSAQIAQLVICNGGCGTTKQALMMGVPILGIITNMDQLLCMQSICKLGAGIMLRTGSVSEENLKESIDKLIFNPTYKEVALNLQGLLNQYDASQNFQEWIKEIIGD